MNQLMIFRLSRCFLIVLAMMCILPLSVFSQKGSEEKSLDTYLSDIQLTTDDILITNQYTSLDVKHVYFKRAIKGLEIYNSYGAVHSSNGNDHYQISLHPSLSSKDVTNIRALDRAQVLENLAKEKRYKKDRLSNEIQLASDTNKATVEWDQVAYGEVVVEPMLYLIGKSDLRHVWAVAIDEVKSGDWMHYFIDAQSGEILNEVSWTLTCNASCAYNEEHQHMSMREHESFANMMTDSTYNVWPYPVESPNHGARSMVEKPWLSNPTASPFGWHKINTTDYTTTRGNNVDAYIDANNTNTPTNGDADRADGGTNLTFDFAWTEDGATNLYKDASVTNLFYWSNIIHDIWFNYGFDEASGNFQSENYTTNGLGGDYVRAEGQDGAGTCNANFTTPPDGNLPRMQMFLCNGQDGDMDNGVIAHEYAHGVSNRLTGGPAAAGCLSNQEQMGEGWSDWMALIMTIEASDMSADPRPIGTYLFNQPTTGNGIRLYPYSTDMAVNPMTYGYVDDSNVSVPHGVGSVWCTMLWDLTWAFIDEYGFDDDFYNGTGGNNKAMRLVLEGMKLQPCSPGFVDGRDAILAADQMLNGGANLCLIWEVFANRGLGYSADQGSSNSKSDGVEAFDLPPACTLELTKTADASQVNAGDIIEYTLVATNNHTADQNNLIIRDDIPVNTTFLDASAGGSLQMDTVVWPTTSSLAVDESVAQSFRVTVDPNVDPVVDDIYDDLESGSTQWSSNASGSTSWNLQSADANSGSFSWFAVDANSTGEAILSFTPALGISANTQLSFIHRYDTEPSWDGGRVQISIDGGNTYQDLGPHFIENGYNSIIFNSIPGFSGNSNGFITSTVDLSSFDGQVATIRFVMSCDAAVGGHGWYIDDMFVEELNRYVPNIATAKTDEFNTIGVLAQPTKILIEASDFTVAGSSSEVSCFNGTDGMASVSASGGSGSYTYLWSNGATINSQNALSEGIYHVDVSDGTLTRRKYFFINQPDDLVLNVTAQQAIDGANGSASANPSGGTGAYSYLWSNGETTQAIENLVAGMYTLTVTDANMCTKEETVEIIDLIASCNESAYMLEMQLDQFPDEYSYTLVDDQNNQIATRAFIGASNGSLHKDIFCLEDGCYTLTISDVYGDGLCTGISSPVGYARLTYYENSAIIEEVCDIGNSYEINFCVGPIIAHVSGVEPSCHNATDGVITASGDGGNHIYTYSWSSGESTAQIQDKGVGTYTVTVSDGANSASNNYTLTYTGSVVTNTNNSGEGSLRNILNNGCDQDTVTFSSSLIGSTIELDSELTIAKSVHVEGLGPYGILLSGKTKYRVFVIEPTGNLSLKSMTLLQAEHAINGGAFYNQGTCTLDNLILRENKEGSINRAFTNIGTLIMKGIIDIRD